MKFITAIVLLAACLFCMQPYAYASREPLPMPMPLPLPVPWPGNNSSSSISSSSYIQIDPLRNRLTLFIDGSPYRTYPIALGKRETPTPVGELKVINKHKNWGSGFGTRWIGLEVPWGTYGIHGTNRPSSIGRDASHGCIRMLNRHVEELYELVDVGTRVVILGHPLGEPHMEARRLAKGDSGADVQLMQNLLQGAGYFKGVCNGRFGPATERALKAFEKDHGLPVDGVMSQHDYLELGIVE